MTGAVLYRLRAEARSRWRAWLALAVLAGVLAGATVALAAGARRTGTAYDRLLERQRPPDVWVLPDDTAQLELVAGLDSVEDTLPVSQFFARTEAEQEPGGFQSYADPIVPDGDRARRAFDRAKLVDGRHADPSSADEVVVAWEVAEELDLAVGDRLRLFFLTEDEVIGSFEGGGLPPLDAGTPRAFEVVGVRVSAGELPPTPRESGLGDVVLTPAFLAEARRAGFFVGAGVGVHVRDGTAGLDRFFAEGEAASGLDVRELVEVLEDRHRETRSALRTPTRALWLLAGLTGLVGLLVVGQAAGRTLLVEGADGPALAALGMGRGRQAVVGLLRAAAIAVAATAIAVGAAVALSPLFPLGLARVAEPDPGLDVDVAGLVLGALGTLLLVAGLATVPALLALSRANRSGRPAPPASRPSWVAGWLARSGARPPLVAGTRLALEPGQGRAAVPVRGAVAGAALGTVVLAAALCFGAGLDRLLSTPDLYGWGWDAQFGDGFGADFYADMEGDLADRPEIDALAVGTTAGVSLDGERVGVLAFGPVRGEVGPTVISGRRPAGADEVLLGPGTADSLGVSVGDEVAAEPRSLYADGQVVEDGRPRTLRVVGEGLFPERYEAPLGEGAVLTLDGLAELTGVERPNRNMVFARFAPGVDADRALAALPDAAYWTPATPPADLVNFGRVDAAPALIATLMALVAVAVLAHTLATAVRRRRRDLALLKTLGFRRRQLSLTVMAQATALVLPALVVGLPVGVALGRWAWTAVATELRVVAEPAVPALALALVVPGALLVANLAAAAPAWAARRTSPAAVLRSE